MHTPEAMDIALLPDGAVLRPDPVSGLAFVETPADAAGAGECAWTFTAPTAGEYVVWARVRAAGPSIPKSDSLFVRLDDGQPVDWHMPGSRTWVWGKVARGVEQVALSFPLTAREHTLRFLTREAGAQVDCVLLTADAAAQPPFSVESGGVFLEAEQGRVTAPMRVVRLENDDAPARLRLVLHAAAPVAFSVDNYDGHRRLHGLARAVNPRFVALLLPLPGGVAEPNVTFTDTPAGVEVWIAWPGRTDRLSWPAGAGQKLSFSAEAG
jgi:hypothetical protein